jgi:hypothetical protein
MGRFRLDGVYINHLVYVKDSNKNQLVIITAGRSSYEITLKSSQSQYSLFSLGMFTYTYVYERQDIIQIALKRLPGGGESRKKKYEKK